MATIYSYNSNNRWCTYTLTMARSGSTVTITASGSIYTNNTSGGDSSNTVYAQLRYGVAPAQTAANPAKNATGTTTYVTDYGTLITSTEGTTLDKGWEIKSKVTKSGSTTIYNNATVLVKPVDSSSSPSKPYNFTITWTKSTNDAINLSNVALFFFKHATSIEAPSNGSYAFIGKKDEQTANYSRYYTQALSVGAGYSKTTAPSSVSTSVDLQKPGGSVKISWSGAAAGTSNPITGYRIYWRRGANPTTSTNDGSHDVSITTTSGSWTMDSFAGASYRDNTYYFKVLTLGTISGYNSDISSDNATCKVNNLPNPPTVTINQGTTTIGSTIYRNKSGTTTIKMTPSATETDEQTNTYYYTINTTSGTKTKWDNTTNFTPSSTTTYYFWSYDTMEFSSSYTTKTITIGANLAGSMGATTSTTTYSNNGTTYTTAGTNTVNLTSGSTGVGTKTYSWSLVCGSTTQSLSSTSNSCTWQYPGSNGWGKTYQIKCEVSDQLSQSFTVTSSTYTIPSAPTFNDNIYNQLGTNVSTMPTTNVTGSVANDFYQTVVTSLTKDTSVTLAFSMTSNATAGWYTGASNSTYQNSGVIPLTITNTSAATAYTLTITPTSAWGGAISPKTYTITRTGLPRIDSNGTRYSASNISTASPTSIKPFTESSVYNFSFLKGNMVSNNNYATTSSSNTSLWLFYGGTEVQVANQGTWTTNSTTGYITVPATRGTAATAGLYNWKTNTLGLNLNSSNVVGLRIKFTDVFGQTYSIDKTNYLTLNFVETPSISFSISNSVSATSGTVIREKDTITYTPNITFYNTDKAVTIKTYVYKATSVSTPSATASGWSLYSGTSSTNGVTYTPNRGTSANSAIIYNTPITYTVGEITESKYLYFKIAVTYGSTTTNSTVPTTYYVSQRHVSITLPFTATFFNNNFSYTSSLNDRGGGKITTSASDKAAGLGMVKYGLQFSQTNDFSTYQWLNSSGNLVNTEAWRNSSTGGSASYSGLNISLGTGWSFYNIRAVYQTNIGSVTKISYSSVVTIYNTAPTISYRKNQIGININNIEESPEFAVVIGAATVGETKVEHIKLQGANNTATINLDTGNLEGFKVNNGNIMSSNTSSRIFVQSSQPSSGMSTGDIWIDISNLT